MKEPDPVTTKLRDPSPPTAPETTPGPSPVQVVAPTRTDASAAPTTGADELASGRIDIDGLNVYYGAFRAVREVSLTVQPHAITAIIGPSGCGKSTFLRTLNRMHELTPETRVEGSVRLDGEDIYGPAIDPVALRRVVGMVFQRPNPFPTMSIYDNVIAGLRLTGRPKTSTYDEVVERCLRRAALWDEVKDKLKRSAFALSGGQQQRLCIARCLAVEPDVILMDEPCSALDPIATARIEDLMTDLKREYTILVVTHNMQQAARVSDMTAFMTTDVDESGHRTGRLVEYDDTDKMFTNPTDPRTEGYITGRFG
jgi:phosphate transport system ATP-binding protein